MRTTSLLKYGYLLLLILFFIAGCAPAGEPAADQAPPTQEVVVLVVTATDEPPTQTPVVIVVTATAEAGTQEEAAEPETEAAETEETVEEAATPEPQATATEEPPPATAVVPACSTLGGLRLRIGPGEIYGIIRNLTADTALVPQAFRAVGFPSGEWIEVAVGTQQGWVSASPQFVSCNFDPASLPAASVIPPTPTPIPSPTAIPPTPTPVVVAQLPISIGQPSNANNPDAGDFPQGRVEWRLETSDDFLFRFYVKDTDVGDFDGAGVDTVTLTVSDQSGNVVDSRKEGTAGYCIFGGGEPVCNPWVFEDGEYKWKSTGKTVVESTYYLTIAVQPKDDDRIWNWDLGGFYVEVP